MKGFDLQLSFNKRPIGGGTNKESADKSKLKITPMGADNDEVITKDLDLSTQLLKLLDSEREIETHPLFAQGLTEGEVPLAFSTLFTTTPTPTSPQHSSPFLSFFFLS